MHDDICLTTTTTILQFVVFFCKLGLSAGLMNLSKEARTKWVLLVVVKYRHRENGRVLWNETYWSPFDARKFVQTLREGQVRVCKAKTTILQTVSLNRILYLISKQSLIQCVKKSVSFILCLASLLRRHSFGVGTCQLLIAEFHSMTSSANSLSGLSSALEIKLISTF